MHKKQKDIIREEEANFTGRSRADRLLDGFYNNSKKRLISNNSYTNSTELNSISTLKKLKSKSQYLDIDNSNSSNKIQDTKIIPPKSTTQALNEILYKHLKSRSKFAKSVKFVNSLIKSNHIDNSNSHLFFNIIYEIVRSENSFTLEDGRNEVLILFSEGIKYYLDKQEPIEFNISNNCSDPNDNIDGLNFNEKKKFLTILGIRIYHIKLFTDDTYQFNNCINHFKTILSELKENSNQSTSELDNNTFQQIVDKKETNENLNSLKKDFFHLQSQINSDLIDKNSNQISQNMSNFWNIPKISEWHYLKLKLFYEALFSIYSFHSKYSWAQSIIESFFQQVYLNRSIFSLDEQNQITLWQSSLKSPLKSRQKLESKTISIGESLNPVKDGREERISTIHGSAIWSAKQMGL